MLPEPQAARADLPEYLATLRPLSEQGNHIAALLLKVLDGPGQTFLEVGAAILKKPANQEVVLALLDAVGAYFRPAW